MRVRLKLGLLAAVVSAAFLSAAPPVSAQRNDLLAVRAIARSDFRTLNSVALADRLRLGVYVNPNLLRPTTGFYGVGGGYGVLNTPYIPPYPAYPSVYPQTYPQPYPVYIPPVGNPYLSTSGSQSTLVTNPSTGGTTLTTQGDPYVSPYTTNAYSSYYDPVSGALNGVANITTSNANATVTYQRARLLQQEAHRSMLDTRRKIWEEARYERASLMNSEQVREANMQTALDRARRDPPLSEIWSGLSLNDLFRHVKDQQAKGINGPAIPLTEDVLKHINLTPGKDGNAGMLKSALQWPIPLQGPEFKGPRENLDSNILEAKKQARLGPVAAGLVNDIKNEIDQMNDILLRNVNNMIPKDYVDAKRFLNALGDAAKALGDPNVTNYFDGKWTAKGKTVEELVKYLIEQGLSFAPAASGDEPSYRALHYALTAYDAGMQQQVSTPPTPRTP